jgi:TonB-dependent SusC/RagA subfamily outer membrane receptor
MFKDVPQKGLLVLASILFFTASWSQGRTVTGTVFDDKNTPLSGATVTVKGTTVSTSTNAEGAFRLQVAGTARTLLVSFVGMQSKEVAISSGSNLSVTLTGGTTTLNDVVVVGYGRSRKANLTTAQASVGAKEIERTVNTTVEQAIQGRAAGVFVTQNSGQPGGGLSVSIRGVSSINGTTEPLYVIDGVQIGGGGSANSSGNLAGLNPADIEDIQILQGPSATAIYGSRATNGVILITTKRGKSGEARMVYGLQYNVQTPPKRFAVMTLPQYAQMQIDYKAIAGGTVRGELLDPSILGPGTDWQSELFNNAVMQKHQLA